MVLRIFSVYDIKSEIFSNPFFLVTKGEALRAFGDLASDKSTSVGKHPEDYRLMCLGTFDNEAGTFAGNEAGSLGFASEYVTVPYVPEFPPSLKAVT